MRTRMRRLCGAAAAVLLAGLSQAGAYAHAVPGCSHRSLRPLDGITFANRTLRAMNELRARHGEAPLVLDPALTAYATRRALGVALRQPGLGGDPHAGLRAGIGEDMYWQSDTDGAPASGTAAVRAWYGEIKRFDFAHPDRYQPATLHFTQLVWADTRRVGIARAFGRRPGSSTVETYVVADFEPAGNVPGHFGREVPPPKTWPAAHHGRHHAHHAEGGHHTGGYGRPWEFGGIPAFSGPSGFSGLGWFPA